MDKLIVTNLNFTKKHMHIAYDHIQYRNIKTLFAQNVGKNGENNDIINLSK